MKKGFKKLLGVLLIAVLILELMPVGNIFNQKVQAAASSVTRIGCHDPSVVKSGSKYYLFGSHLSTVASTDLNNWSNTSTNVTTNYASIFAKNGEWSKRGSSNYSMSGNMWAPDVIYNKAMGKWCMYMSINGDNFYSSIAMATSSSIDGPYTYAGTIVYSGFANSTDAALTDYKKVTGTNTVASRYLSNGKWNGKYGTSAIDPCVLYDAAGNLWMSYGSWFGGIYMIKLDKNTGLRDYTNTYTTTTNVSDQYMGIRLSGGYGLTGEGSYIIYDKSAGYYYMYVSYGGLCATTSFSNYNMRVFRSKTITGPYLDPAGNTAVCKSASDDQTKKGLKVMGNYAFSSLKNAASNELYQNGYMSQGHNSALIDTDGSRYLIYHTRFNNGTEAHEVRVHQQFINQDGWPVTAVYEKLGSKISSTGYSSSDMVGTYEVVFSGNAAGAYLAPMLETKKIVLNSNGSITGDLTGTWSYSSGTAYCSIVIGGVTYKGVFFKQYDESAAHLDTMTFTLAGTNDQSLMGSKIASTTSYVPKTVGASTPGLDGIYYVKSKSSGLYLDVANGSSANGTNIQQWAYNGSEAQKFMFVSNGSGYYYILTGASGYKSAVDTAAFGVLNGTNIAQWEYWGADAQLYEVIKTSTGHFAIKTKCSGSIQAIEVYAWSTANGGNIDTWEYWGGDCQLWSLIDADSLQGNYSIKNLNSGLYLDVANGSSADGTNIQQTTYNGSHAQIFRIVPDGKGYYYILTQSSNYKSCLDVNGPSASDGANIQEWAYWGGDGQKFSISQISTGNYAFKTKISGNKSCIDVYGSSTAAGGNIVQWTYWGGNCQLFNLIKK